MPEKLFQVFNGPTPTTAATVAVTTGTAIKTLLQIATPSTHALYIVEFGISFNGSAAATPIKVELLTCTGAATVTAHVDGDVTRLTNPVGPGTLMTLGTSAGGYTASAEGTPASVDMLDAQFVAPTGQYIKQWPLGREPVCALSRFVRVRVHAPAAVDAITYIVYGE